MKKIKSIIASATIGIAGVTGLVLTTGAGVASADGPGHIIIKSGDAVYTTGQVGSLVRFGKYRVSNHGEDFNMDNFANPYGAGAFFWAPGGTQTNDYLKVTTSKATLVSGAPNATIFDPVKYGNYTVLALNSSSGPTRNVLSDVNGMLVIAKEGKTPTSHQLFTIR